MCVVFHRVATLRMAEDKVKDELYEMSKPLARYVDDEDLERMLKERERDGDPMLKFIKKKPKLTPAGKPKKGIYMYLVCICTRVCKSRPSQSS